MNVKCNVLVPRGSSVSISDLHTAPGGFEPLANEALKEPQMSSGGCMEVI